MQLLYGSDKQTQKETNIQSKLHCYARYRKSTVASNRNFVLIQPTLTLNFIGLIYMTYNKSIHKCIQNPMRTQNEHQCSSSLSPFDQSQHSLVLKYY